MLKTIIAAVLVVCTSAMELNEGDQLLRINPRSDVEVQELRRILKQQELNTDAWNYPTLPNVEVDVHVKMESLQDIQKDLREMNIDHTTADLNEMVAQEEKSNKKEKAMFAHNAAADAFDYKGYNGYDDIVRELKRLASTNRLASTFEVGKTYENRMLVGIKISNDRSKTKPAVWVDGGIHAREWIAPATAMYFIKLVLENPSDTLAKAVLDKYDIYVLPVFNADGYEYTRSGGNSRLWRKTRTPNKNSKCVGTDPNRNWDAFWGPVGTSTNPCSDVYKGTAPESEPCVRVVSRYLDQLKATVGLTSYWNVHAFSQFVLTPWSYTSKPTKDDAEIQRVGQIYAEAVKKETGEDYKVGSPASILYAVMGGSMDYTYKKLGVIHSYAIELRPASPYPYGFMLPAKYIPDSGRETTKGLLAAFNAIGAGPVPTSVPGCVDKDKNCPDWSWYCGWNDYVDQNCGKTCKTC